jgi:small subunit ribosomal protein S6
MENYEALFALVPNLTEEKVENLLSRFEKRVKDHGGELVKCEKWGSKKLPFTFQRHKALKEAFYVLLVFKGTGETVNSLRDAFRIQEEVIRHLILRAKEAELPLIEESTFPAEPAKEESLGQP